MPTITAIRRSKARRVSLYLDGALAASLDAGAVAEAGLAVGQDLTPQSLEALLKDDATRRCHAAALRLLAYRPRSEAELRRRLARLQYDAPAIDGAMRRLKAENLIDDEAFAAYWREQRQAFSPRSGRLVRAELRAKGVAQETAEAAAGEINDESAAYDAALKRALRLAGEEYEAFAKALGGFLQRRGFSYEVAQSAIRRLWREQRGELEP